MGVVKEKGFSLTWIDGVTYWRNEEDVPVKVHDGGGTPEGCQRSEVLYSVKKSIQDPRDDKQERFREPYDIVIIH